ncbi:hypothetical protein TFUB4_01801 [Tannerella forsythia]|uniref:Uncharacterized protein n=1 Tax=Tannerella forsythia TaxID=28112 RepID=A0A1D3UVB3_TANFO|nr:hypothetical protein TFUB4_01801 [Tannerella forsythia]SCQ22773.1 hypothetical protein TFUB20_01826 [Tannerella forsythia]SCQ23948.1 hypothetical protein TFUB22_01793 [Tannerella forsythia]
MDGETGTLSEREMTFHFYVIRNENIKVYAHRVGMKRHAGNVLFYNN